MESDFTTLPPEDRYRYLCAFVAPRPIALVTTVSASGVRNAAPMSFFNVFSQEPLILILGIQSRPDGAIKDTIANIDATGVFVVNMVDRKIAEAMVICGLHYPPEVDEVAASGLSWIDAYSVKGGRIAEIPAAMECEVEQIIRYPSRAIVLGRVLHMHIDDACLTEDRRHVRPEVYHPVARLHGNNYVVADQQIVLDPPDLPPTGIIR